MVRSFFRRLGLLSCLLMACTAHAGDKLHYNVISLQVTAEREVTNDLMMVSLTAQHEHKQSSQAASAVNLDTQWALDLVKKYPSVKASTRNYSTQPRYDDRRIVGWIVRQQVFLESEDFEQLAELSTSLQKKLQIDQMGFRPTRATRLAMENALTKEALKAFQAKADLIAEGLGQEEYEVVEINLGGGQRHYPVMRHKADMMMSARAESSVAVEAGTSKVQVTASGRIQLH